MTTRHSFEFNLDWSMIDSDSLRFELDAFKFNQHKHQPVLASPVPRVPIALTHIVDDHRARNRLVPDGPPAVAQGPTRAATEADLNFTRPDATKHESTPFPSDARSFLFPSHSRKNDILPDLFNPARPTIFLPEPHSVPNMAMHSAAPIATTLPISTNPPNPPRPGFRTGDWICPAIRCGEHNFGRNTTCRSCASPRPPSFSTSTSTMVNTFTTGPTSPRFTTHAQNATAMPQLVAGLGGLSLDSPPAPAAHQQFLHPHPPPSVARLPPQRQQSLPQPSISQEQGQQHLLTPSGSMFAEGGRVQNISPDPLAPCVLFWPDNEPLPDPGQLRPHSVGFAHPPILNTGNRGPIEHQPGDWVCKKCNYLNWRRRKVCQTCYPYAEGNGDSISATVQANRIASLKQLLEVQQAQLNAHLAPQQEQQHPKESQQQQQQQQIHTAVPPREDALGLHFGEDGAVYHHGHGQANQHQEERKRYRSHPLAQRSQSYSPRAPLMHVEPRPQSRSPARSGFGLDMDSCLPFRVDPYAQRMGSPSRGVDPPARFDHIRSTTFAPFDDSTIRQGPLRYGLGSGNMNVSNNANANAKNSASSSPFSAGASPRTPYSPLRSTFDPPASGRSWSFNQTPAQAHFPLKEQPPATTLLPALIHDSPASSSSSELDLEGGAVGSGFASALHSSPATSCASLGGNGWSPNAKGAAGSPEAREKDKERGKAGVVGNIWKMGGEERGVGGMLKPIGSERKGSWDA